MSGNFEVIKNSPLFKGIAYSTLKEIEMKCSPVSFRKDDEIIRDEDRGDRMYILKKGSVSVIKKLTLLSDDRDLRDKELIILNAEKYDFFGEMVLCSATDTRSATVRANTDCEVLEITSEDIHGILASDPQSGMIFYKNLSALLSDRLRKANRDIVKLTTALTLALEEQ